MRKTAECQAELATATRSTGGMPKPERRAARVRCRCQELLGPFGVRLGAAPSVLRCLRHGRLGLSAGSSPSTLITWLR